MLKPIENNSIYIKCKSINGQPFLEVTLFNGTSGGPVIEKAIDQSTLRPTENMELHRIINQWLFSEA